MRVSELQPASALVSYLPRLVREWPGGTPHQELDGSMVFVDVSGFTKMSERLARRGRIGAEEVTEVIRDTFGRLLTEAYGHGGSLLKFGGDALLLFFSEEDHALRAVAAAHAMRAELRRLSTFKTSAGLVTLRMSVGVHSGGFHFFLAGESHRELVVCGPAATQTVAMETAASAGQILLSPASARALPDANLGSGAGGGVLLRGRPPVIDRLPIIFPKGEGDLLSFIPLALRETALTGGLEAEHRPVTVAFVHFAGIDALIEEGGPAQVGDALGRLMETAQAAVDSRQLCFLGTDIAADGGKIILTAGAPIATGHDQELMLLALTDILAAQIPLVLRAGVNRGSVFAGEIGPLYRRTYTVMGDAVNLAARLMAKAGPNEILATREVISGSRTVFSTQALEPFQVKGKKAPVHALRVGEVVGSRSFVSEAAIPVIGRDRELQLLAAAWDEARLGRGRLVEIRAEPGMGKSRLLSAFIESCPDVVTIRTECRLYQSATPYYPFKSLLRRSLGLDSLTDAEAAVRLDEIVRTKAPHLLPWLSLIGVPMGIDLEGSEESDRLDDKYRRRRLEESVDALLSVVLVEPAILAIEDAHWMDEASLDLLRKLTSDLGRRPWLVCLTRQGDAGGDLDGQRGALTIDLQPLEASHAAELIIAATESAPLMPDTVAELARRAAGNPLFLIELLEALGRGEDLDYLPDSVEEMIGARIDRLPPSDRQLLRRVAVLGVGFRADHLAAVADPAESDLGRVLDRLSGFITRDATGWVQFRHALLRDVAYRGLPYRLRRQLHCSVADSIRAMGKSASETRAELLSVHYFEAGNWGQAWTYSRLAGDQAKAIYANQDAAKFYLRALRSAQYCEEIPPPELAAAWEALGDVRELGGVYDGALTAFLRASRLIRTDPLAQANLALKRARARMRVGAYQLALAETTKGRRLAERVTSTDGMKARARLLSFRSMLRMAQERPREALALAEQAVLEAESAGEEEALARAYSTMDWSYYMLGEPHKATHLTQALAIYQRLGQVERAADVMNNIGAFAYLDGDWARAVEWFSKSRDAFKQAGDESGAALVGANIGEVLVGQGRLAEAEPILVESVRVLRASHGRDDAIAAEIALARLHLEERDYEEATRLLEQLRREALELGQIVHALEVALYLADCVTRAGDPEAALALLEQASAEAGGEAAMLASTMARVRAEALVELGRLDEAGAEIAIGLSQARQQGLLYEEALLLRARIDLASRSGQDADPTESARAMELLARLGVRQASAARFIPS